MTVFYNTSRVLPHCDVCRNKTFKNILVKMFQATIGRHPSDFNKMTRNHFFVPWHSFILFVLHFKWPLLLPAQETRPLRRIYYEQREVLQPHNFPTTQHNNYIWMTQHFMMTSSNENIFCVTGHFCGEFTGLRWVPRTKASDAELWCFLWSASE